MTKWTVTWKSRGNEKAISCFSKKAAIHEYLDLLDMPFARDISELKIFKNGKEYTGTLNRFLAK